MGTGDDKLRVALQEIGEKYANATEFYDEFVKLDFTPLSLQTKHLVNFIGNEILALLKGDSDASAD